MANPSGTGVVSYNSELVRKKWIRDGLVQKAANSFWSAYKGNSKDSIIYQVNDMAASTGKTVVFDMDGALAGKPVRGKTTATGKGEQKKKFSDKVTISDYRYVVDNGDKFDGVNIGDLSINEHANSRSLLGDLWIRSSDQAYFDLGQQTTDFGLDLDNEFTFDHLLDIENVIKSGEGFTTKPVGLNRRVPLEPFQTKDGRSMWLFVIDNSMKNMLMKTTGAQNLFAGADVRGNDNRLFKGVLGTIGNFIIVEAPYYFGVSEQDILDSEGYYNYDNNAVYSQGLRQYQVDSVSDLTGKVWTGYKDFDYTVGASAKVRRSRGIILGKSAFLFGMGKMPDYKYEEHDFGKFSESALEVWCAAKPCKLLAENQDYEAVKIAGFNYGSIFVDVTVSPSPANP